MGRLVGRLLGLALAGFVAFLASSLAFAASRKRDAPPPPPAEADEVALTAIFDSLQFASTAGAFRGGTLEAWFGGGTIDLSAATLAPEGAVLRVTAVFGGAAIAVPAGWRVATNLTPIFGGAGDARGASAPDDGPELVIEGIAVFGGIGVITADMLPASASA